MSRITTVWIVLTLFATSSLGAQLAREHRAPATVDSFVQHSGMGMMTGPLEISPTRDGSGTAWLPDASPMFAHHLQSMGWELMLHENVFVQYIDEGGARGSSQFGSINWGMVMLRGPLGGGEVGVRTMVSTEPLTVGECGYPDLLATGEFCEGGRPIVDRQHPHDLFMEVSAQYRRALSPNLAVQLYGGPVGEPALGPVAYPHRVSASSNPIAPISHHWLDATHISFGVLTAGVYGRRWKLEGSIFNGREPDEDRYDFDFDRLDSYSGRVWFLPNDRWAFQISTGRLNDAEPTEGGRDVTRTTASATYHRPAGQMGTWATTATWGRNAPQDEAGTNAFLLETSVDRERNVVFGRLDVVQKTADDLVVALPGEEAFAVGKLTAGYVRELRPLARLVASIGAGVSVSFVPSDLEPFYGSRLPVGFVVFARLHPAPMEMDTMLMNQAR